MATNETSLKGNPGNPFVIVESHFDEDAEGWTKDGDTLTFGHSPTDGNPGGCLKYTDRRTGGVVYYVAPKKFLGDKQFAVQLEYDIKWVAGSLPIFTWDRELELAGGGVTLIYHPGPPPRGAWTHCVVPFHPIAGVWIKISGNVAPNQPATESDFQTVLGALDRLAIRGEFAEGSPETGFLDNVVMYVNPPGVPPSPE